MTQMSQDHSLNLFLAETLPGDSRQARQLARRQLIVEAVMAEGAIRIEEITERYGISLMTAHRDIDELAGVDCCINPVAWFRQHRPAWLNPAISIAQPVNWKRNRLSPKWR